MSESGFTGFVPTVVINTAVTIWRWVTWIRRHHKIVVAIGGLLASGCLAIKDKAQDRLREFSNEIRAAADFNRLSISEGFLKEGIDDSRAEMSASFREVLRRQDLLNAQAGNVKAKKTSSQSLSDQKKNNTEEQYRSYVRANIDVEIEKYSELDEECNRTLLLGDVGEQKKMSDDLSDQAHAIGRIRQMIGGVQSDLHNLNLTTESGTFGRDIVQSDGVFRSELVAEELDKISRESLLLREELNQHSRAMIDSLNDEKERLKTRTLIVSVFCYLGVALGIGISATGHLAGRDGELPELPKAEL